MLNFNYLSCIWTLAISVETCMIITTSLRKHKSLHIVHLISFQGMCKWRDINISRVYQTENHPKPLGISRRNKKTIWNRSPMTCFKVFKPQYILHRRALLYRYCASTLFLPSCPKSLMFLVLAWNQLKYPWQWHRKNDPRAKATHM